MATTIITKNGSGAPLAGDLTAGELAVDLTNKRLYSKDSLGNVIELGTNAGSSTFADLTVSGDLTVDTNTLYVDSTNNAVGINTVTASGPQSTFHIEQNGDDADGGFRLSRDNALASYTQYINTSSTWNLAYGNPSSDDSPTDIISVTTSGNVGIGTSSPSSNLHVYNGADAEEQVIIAEVSGAYSNGAGVSLRRSGTEMGRINADYFNGMTFHATTGSGGAATERMRIDSSGNVGIGRTPSYVLDVEGDATPIFALRSNSNTGSSLMFFGRPNDVDAGRIGYDHTNDLMYFRTAGSEAMRITSGGNVGIGESNPLNPLHITVGGSDFATIRLDAPSNVTPATFGIRAHDGKLDIRNFQNSTTPLTLDASGNLLVGAASSSQTADDGIKLRAGTSPTPCVVGAATTGEEVWGLYSTGASSFRFYVTYAGTIHAASTSITAISDASLKENVRDLDKGLDTILALQPRRFDWINGDGNDIMGFIAQEVEEVMPELVHDYRYDGNETKKGLKMGDMIPSMVKAIQEQQAMIETLQAQVAELQGAN